VEKVLLDLGQIVLRSGRAATFLSRPGPGWPRLKSRVQSNLQRPHFSVRMTLFRRQKMWQLDATAFIDS
jgi:hypothetical protein